MKRASLVWKEKRKETSRCNSHCFSRQELEMLTDLTNNSTLPVWIMKAAGMFFPVLRPDLCGARCYANIE